MPSSDLDALIAAQIEVEKGNSKGGNKGFTCLHCEIRYFGSRSRQLAHLLGTKGKGSSCLYEDTLRRQGSAARGLQRHTYTRRSGGRTW